MKKIIFFITILMVVLVSSCHQNADTKNEETTVQDIQMAAPPMADNVISVDGNNGLIAIADSTGAVLHAGQPNAKTDWDKKLIKTALITLQLDNYLNYNNAVHQVVKRYGAYIASEQQQESDYKIENIITIKVPVTEFESLVNAFPSEGIKVLEKRVSTEDVTGEVVDTKARIEAKKQVRDRYYDLLKQAKNMKEILEVQAEINNLQESIEAGSGRVQYLSQQSAYSTIHLTYFQVLNTEVNPNDTPAFYTRLATSFQNGAEIVKGFLLLLVTIWPVLLAALAAWMVVKKLNSQKVVKKVG